MTLEERELTIKRLRHRSRQRGFAEADEIFIAFARDYLDGLSDAQLTAYGQLLNLPDWDTFAWISGQTGQTGQAPDEFSEIVDLVQKSLRA